LTNYEFIPELQNWLKEREEKWVILVKFGL
jgi:N-dimethylarginine dimethylaminohydrolase